MRLALRITNFPREIIKVSCFHLKVLCYHNIQFNPIKAQVWSYLVAD